jgi:hypothetical protein
VQRGIARALRVILVCNRCSEERHDAIARVLVHRTFEAMHALGQDLEEAIQDAVPDLGIDLFGQLHRPFTSPNRTVTCLRSPSSADFDCRILSARCRGV